MFPSEKTFRRNILGAGAVPWKEQQRGASPGPFVCREGSCSSWRAVSRREYPTQGSGCGSNLLGSRVERVKSVALNECYQVMLRSLKEGSVQ